MKSRKRVIILNLIVLLALFISLMVISGLRTRNNVKTKNISLIVYGNDSNRWENLYQGAELALKDYDAEISFITMSAGGDADEQISLVEREIASGADGILLAACDKNAIGDYLDNNRDKLPIVLVENGVNSKKYIPLVSADDYEMGKSLGEELVHREKPITTVAIISENEELYGITDRQQGVLDAISDYVSKVLIWKRNANEGHLSTQLFLQRALVSEAVDCVVALDDSTADALIDALNNLNKTVKAYGISTSDKSVYSLDQGCMVALDYQTEFAIGYEGAICLMESEFENHKIKIEPIEHRVITKADMYDFDNQKLIFPFVK